MSSTCRHSGVLLKSKYSGAAILSSASILSLNSRAKLDDRNQFSGRRN